MVHVCVSVREITGSVWLLLYTYNFKQPVIMNSTNFRWRNIACTYSYCERTDCCKCAFCCSTHIDCRPV